MNKQQGAKRAWLCDKCLSDKARPMACAVVVWSEGPIDPPGYCMHLPEPIAWREGRLVNTDGTEKLVIDP